MLRLPGGFSLIMNFTMATLILLFGAVLMFTELYADVIKKPNREYLAFVFFGYAAWRYYRGWQLHKKEERDKQRDEWKDESKKFRK